MTRVVHALDSLHQRISQFSLVVYDRDVYAMISRRNEALDYAGIMRQIEFEEHIRGSLLINGLRPYFIGMLVYIDDERYHYVGEGTVDPRIVISGLDWYKNFTEAGGGSMVIGPMTEGFRPYIGQARESVLFLTELTTPAGVRTEQTPFVLMVISAESIADYLYNFFGQGESFFIIADDQIVFSANLEEWREDFADFIEQNLMRENNVISYRDNEVIIMDICVPQFGWTLYVVSATQELFADIRDLVGTLIIILVVCIVLGVLAARFISHKMMRPIATVNQMVSDMQQGAESKENSAYESDMDELAHIGRQIITMKSSLKESAGRIHTSELREKHAQLLALQAQINPHFLYNTLDNIYCIAQLKGESDIATLTASLSSMMRYSIETDDMYATIGDELEHIRQYVSIINTRYDGAIRYSEKVDVGLYEIQTIKLLLQPLVENAWMHGISPKSERQGNIELSATVMDGRLLIKVEDDGVGIDEKNLIALHNRLLDSGSTSRESNNSFGLGLKNVHDRIRFAYGKDYGISIDSDFGKGSSVSIWLKI